MCMPRAQVSHEHRLCFYWGKNLEGTVTQHYTTEASATAWLLPSVHWASDSLTWQAHLTELLLDREHPGISASSP